MKLLSNMSILASAAFASSLTFASPKLTGTVKIDGSSTVFPITEAVAEAFQEVQPRVRVTIGVSGTGGGFKKFLAHEIDINNASRRIKEKEIKKANEEKISFTELPVAYDGISVVINKENTWASKMTMDQLKKIWEPNSKVKKWSDVDPSWPSKEIKLYGPGPDSGTFDYFTKKVNGKERATRADYTASEDDNVIVNGIAGDKYSLGYFGYAYFHENRAKLNSVALKKTSSDYIAPSIDSIAKSTYPLARPIFIYVSHTAMKRPEVKEFVEFYMKNADVLSKEVGYIPMGSKTYAKNLSDFLKKIKG